MNSYTLQMINYGIGKDLYQIRSKNAQQKREMLQTKAELHLIKKQMKGEMHNIMQQL